MAGRRFLIDEWILADIRGDNGRGRQIDAADLLEAIRVKCDGICLPLASPWTTKAYEIMTFADPIRRGLSKQLQGLIVNAEKCAKVEPDDLVALPHDVDLQIPDDDRYLFQAMLAANAEVLVTTDGTLLNVGPQLRFLVRERQEFVGTYLGRFVAP